MTRAWFPATGTESLTLAERNAINALYHQNHHHRQPLAPPPQPLQRQNHRTAAKAGRSYTSNSSAFSHFNFDAHHLNQYEADSDETEDDDDDDEEFDPITPPPRSVQARQQQQALLFGHQNARRPSLPPPTLRPRKLVFEIHLNDKREETTVAVARERRLTQQQILNATPSTSMGFTQVAEREELDGLAASVSAMPHFNLDEPPRQRRRHPAGQNHYDHDAIMVPLARSPPQGQQPHEPESGHQQQQEEMVVPQPEQKYESEDEVVVAPEPETPPQCSLPSNNEDENSQEADLLFPYPMPDLIASQSSADLNRALLISCAQSLRSIGDQFGRQRDHHQQQRRGPMNSSDGSIALPRIILPGTRGRLLALWLHWLTSGTGGHGEQQQGNGIAGGMSFWDTLKASLAIIAYDWLTH